MASRRISTPMRGIISQLNKASLKAPQKVISTSFARPITTSASSRASVSTINSSTEPHTPIIPFEQQTVHATIHRFPSLEPLRFESFPANHLNLPTRRDILHRAVIFEGDATRRGTASTKWRSEVHGSNKKIRPQKGSGRARLGDKKTPMLRGGGVAFGPRPRDFSSGLQKKVYDLAWRTALSYRFKKGELIIVDNSLEIEKPSPQLVRDLFEIHGWGNSAGRSLLVTLQHRPFLNKALEETPKEGRTLTWQEVDVKDLLELGRIVIEREALRNILLAHQDDIRPKGQGMAAFTEEEPTGINPVSLEAETGWLEFADLESADPETLETLRPAHYQSVGQQRLEAAEAINNHQQLGAWDEEASWQFQDLEISAYELLSEAAKLQADIEAKHPHIQLATSEEEDEQLLGLQQRMKMLECQIDSMEYGIQSLQRQGQHEEADKWRESLEELQNESAEVQFSIDELMGIVPEEEVVDEEVDEVEERKK